MVCIKGLSTKTLCNVGGKNKAMEHDQSVIDISDIIAILPSPQVKDDTIKLYIHSTKYWSKRNMIFPSIAINLYEKSVLQRNKY